MTDNARHTTALLTHNATGRTTRAAVIIAAVWLVVLILWVVIDLSPWVAIVLLATTLPAALDFANGRKAWLRLSDTMLEWGSGRASGEIALVRLDHIRLETRLDLSIRVRLVLRDHRRISLPQDCLPPIADLKSALDARGIKTQRHHFSLLS